MIKEDELLKDISILALVAILFSGAEPFVQLCQMRGLDDIMRNISVILF